MKTILSSNVAYYHHAAIGLERDGRLLRYITGIVPEGRGTLANRLPAYWRAKLEGRATTGIPPEKIRSLTVPEVIQKAVLLSRLGTLNRSEWVSGGLFDRVAKRHIDPCDVFHFTTNIGLACARRARDLGALIVCDERRTHPDHQREVLSPEYRALGLKQPDNPLDPKAKREYETADALIVCSAYAKQTFVERGFNPDRVYVTEYGFDPNHFSATGTPDERFTVLFVGRLSPRKAPHHLVSAFRRLVARDARLEIIGPIDQNFRQVITRLAEGDSRIALLGEVPRLQLKHHYQRASVVVVPSLTEPFSLVCLEGMGSARPIITTTATGASSSIRDGVHGYVIEPGDIEALADRLTRLYSDRDLAQEMGRKALSQAQKLTWNNYRAQLSSAYDRFTA